MIEYIDKRATAEHIDMYAKLLTMGDFRSGMMKAKEILLNQEPEDIAPTAPKIIRGTDIVQVVHSEWIYHMSYGVCKKCGYEYEWKGTDAKNYCPYCGAKMDGERKE